MTVVLTHLFKLLSFFINYNKKTTFWPIHQLRIAFANESIYGKSVRIFVHSHMMNILAENFHYRFKSVGWDRAGTGVPSNLYKIMYCFTSLEQSPDGASGYIRRPTIMARAVTSSPAGFVERVSLSVWRSKKDLLAAFTSYDQNKDGRISTDEARLFLSREPFNLSEEKVSFILTTTTTILYSESANLRQGQNLKLIVLLLLMMMMMMMMMMNDHHSFLLFLLS